MHIPYTTIRAACLVYLAVPVLIFLGGWIRPVVGMPMLVLAVVALFLAASEKRRDIRVALDHRVANDVYLSWPTMILLAIAVVVWCVICGQGGFVVQKGDWRARNALFRDLITHEWPVLYTQVDAALCYYVGHWLPAACLAKLARIFGGYRGAWTIGNVTLLLWSATGIFLSCLMLMTLRLRRLMFFMLAFALFGGLDIISFGLRELYLLCSGLVPNLSWGNMDACWGVNGFQFSSHVTLLSWVFNQSVAPWLATAVLVSGTPLRIWGVCLCPLLIVAPFPFVGLFLLMMGLFLFYIVRWEGLVNAIKDSMSLCNVLSVLSMMVLPALYLKCNMAGGSFCMFLHWTWVTPLEFLGFLALEIGVPAICLWNGESRRSPWYALSLISIFLALPSKVWVARSTPS